VSDYEFFLALVCASSVLTFGAAFGLAKFRSRWSARKVALISALPLPGLLMACMAFVIAHAQYTGFINPQECGVDACGMAMMFGFIGLAAGMAAYVIALLPAFLGVRLAR
jgi:predicted permease